MVHLLNILRHGLFCLLAGSVLIDLSLIGFAAGVVSIFYASDRAMAMLGLSAICLMIGALVGCLGMLMSLAVPDSSARLKVGVAVLCELGGVVTQLAGGPFLLRQILFVLGWLMFLKFLESVADSVNSDRSNDAIRAIFYVAGFNTFIVWMILIAWPMIGALVFIGIWLLDACLYGYLLYSLVADLGVYIENVRSGRIDPTAKGKAGPTLFNRVSSVAAPPAEEPTGPAPEGWKVCRIPKSMPPLHTAVKDGDHNKITAELRGGADLHEKAKNDLTPLHIATIGGVMDLVDRLIRDGARVDEPAAHGLTALFMAVQACHLNLVGFLVSKGARLEHANQEGFTPLHWACCAPHERLKGSARVKMVETLLARGASLEAVDRAGRTPRALAEAQGLKTVVHAIDRFLGVAPVSAASPHPQVMVPVAQEEAPPPKPRFQLEGAEMATLPEELPALHSAAKLGDTDKVNWHLQSGAKVDSKASNGLTALHIAAISGVMAVADMLLKRGALVDETSDGGLTALYFAIQANNVGMVGLLLTRKANINHQNEQGRTPLHWACALSTPKLDGQARTKMAQLLLSKGADLEIVDQGGKTPRALAQTAGNLDVVTAIDRYMAPDSPAARSAEDDDD